MIATLEGLIGEKSLEGVVLEVQGVGYGLYLSSEDLSQLNVGEQVKLYVYEYIREQAHDLYGFKAVDTKRLFEQLLDVKNVGPKVARAVLNIGPNATVREAIATGNVKLLQTAKGAGKRAAEQIIVELRDKVGYAPSEAAESIVNRPGVNLDDEAVQALVSLGYSPQDAVTALRHVSTDLSVEDRVKQALKG